MHEKELREEVLNNIETISTLTFYPRGTGEIVCYSPEDVARAGIAVFPDSLNVTFGPDAGQRYQEARGLIYEPEETAVVS